jgi:hypothetical protein
MVAVQAKANRRRQELVASADHGDEPVNVRRLSSLSLAGVTQLVLRTLQAPDATGFHKLGP